MAFESSVCANRELLEQQHRNKEICQLVLRMLEHLIDSTNDNLRLNAVLQCRLLDVQRKLTHYEQSVALLEDRLRTWAARFASCQSRTCTKLQFSTFLDEGLEAIDAAIHESLDLGPLTRGGLSGSAG